MESQSRLAIIEACRRLYARNLLAAADGNVSVRLSERSGERPGDDRILMTPSGLPKAFIAPEQIAVINLNGDILEGHPSAERLMHLEIYRRSPKAMAVVHAHPPHAVAWSLSRPELVELPCDALGEVILGAGQIPIVPYARPTTSAMADALGAYLPQCRALILARHGAVCWGESLEEAMGGMERIEHVAQTLYLAENLGGARPLPADEIRALKAMRAQMGDKLL